MHRQILSALQLAFLEHFFATESGSLFFLTGGTALSAFHLHHRLSVDLDLFTLDDLGLQATDALITQLADTLMCKISQARRTEHFRQYFLEPPTGEPLKIDLVREFGPQFGEHIYIGNIIVDSLENIGANKLTAILGRTEPKDFIDLYFILRTGQYTFDDLLAKAEEKDLGLHPFYMAGALLEVRHLHHLPITTPPVSKMDVVQTIVALANTLLDRLNPDA
ncbi:MAG: nucleotidyl transferase AbiEii/AbiGii toxin family protein [Caldilineaceae bacterium]